MFLFLFQFLATLVSMKPYLLPYFLTLLYDKVTVELAQLDTDTETYPLVYH